MVQKGFDNLSLKNKNYKNYLPFTVGHLILSAFCNFSLKRHWFQTIEEIKENKKTDLKSIPESAYKESFHKWKSIWSRVYLPKETTLNATITMQIFQIKTLYAYTFLIKSLIYYAK